MKHLLRSLEAQVKALFQQQNELLPISKWVWPSTKSVEMQLATSAGAGIQV